MTQTQDGVVVGIDLGTTYSLVSVLADGVPVVLPNALGELLTPSAVGLDDDGRLLVGAAARARAVTHPSATALMFKRDMGTAKTVSLGPGHTYRPEELSAMVLASLKRDAEAALGMPVVEAVVTVPAYFGEVQRQATKDAAAIAGLHVERIINEPTAAAIAYGMHALGRELRIAVLDLGGGTFDVSVLEIIEGIVEIQGSAGDARLGGEDFTDALAVVIGARLDAEHGATWREDGRSVARVREAAEQAKRSLGEEATASIALPGLVHADGPRDFATTLAASDLSATFAPLVERMKAPIFRALRDASVLPTAVDEVLLVGGATRMACVSELAASIFRKLPLRRLPPDEAVAMGAAVQCALKHGDAAVEDLVVTDVAPFSLGIATSTRSGAHAVDGIFTPILERGTVIPASRVERFFSMEDNQTEITVEIYQGEHSLCRDNVKLGALHVKGLPKKRAGEAAVDIRFTYDLNGLLDVDVSIVGTARTDRLSIEQRPGQLGKEQLAKAREAMARLKFHPRDALPNRTALARAEALFAELSGSARHELSFAMQRLRLALESQDRALTDEAREALVRLIQELASLRGR